MSVHEEKGSIFLFFFYPFIPIKPCPPLQVELTGISLSRALSTPSTVSVPPLQPLSSTGMLLLILFQGQPSPRDACALLGSSRWNWAVPVLEQAEITTSHVSSGTQSASSQPQQMNQPSASIFASLPKLLLIPANALRVFFCFNLTQSFLCSLLHWFLRQHHFPG